MKAGRSLHVLAFITAAAAVGAVGLWRWPFPDFNDILLILWNHNPRIVTILRWTYVALWFTTPALVLLTGSALAFIFLTTQHPRSRRAALPPYPDPAARPDLALVLGEVHHPTRPEPADTPRWLTLPERGLCTGIAIVGAIGSGKTTGCMYPYVDQLLAYRATDPELKIGGLVLEVKGDFCHHLAEIARARGRAADYVEVGIDGRFRYNPLHNDLEAYSQAYGIATLINNVYGRSDEPFWQQAYTNLVKFIILLHKVVDGYVTLSDVYTCAIDPDAIAAKIAAGEQRLAGLGTWACVTPEAYLSAPALHATTWRRDVFTGQMIHPLTPDLRKDLASTKTTFTTRELDLSQLPDAHATRHEEFESVKRWYHQDWTRMENKLRTSIVEGISVFLSLFDDNPAVKYTFCPPKQCYDPVANADGKYGTPLPPFTDLIESGRICALNFPVVANPGLARTIGTLMKHDFQRAVQARIPRMAHWPDRPWRHVFFACDEYHAFATVGEQDPSGDEKFFALSRQARCIPIVATQSLSSLKSALHGDVWRTLFQTFRTKIFLSLSDDFSAKVASELCGKTEQLKPHYSLSENSQDARVSMLTGRAASHRATLTASKSYSVQRDWVFEPKVFTELQNMQAIVLAYDGMNPHPPTFCYLKPYYLNPNWTYFDQVEAGAL